jgi:tetratricopeptide (TPR) repeat protein
MPKPGRRSTTPSDEMARFTDRESHQSLFHRHLNAAEEPPVVMFYGVGGAGKTWLLKKLRTQVPIDIPSAYLDFDVAAGGRRFVLDPATALQSIRQQLNAPAPRFDLALAVLRHKQGSAEETGLWIDVAAELLGTFVPGAGSVLKRLSGHALSRLKGTALEKFLASASGTQLAIELRSKTDQEIGNELLYYLAADLRESLPVHLNRAVNCVIFLDTFEAVGAGFQNEEHKRLQEKWIQDLAAEFDFAFTVIAGQNRLSWDDADPEWASHLDQHLVGGLSEEDARHFLFKCEIGSTDLQNSILATSKESTGGYHCFSLGLCVDIVLNERKAGHEPTPDTLHFNPQEWEKLARRFLKSLASDAERRWIERLALTPRFDEAAARKAFSSEQSAAQDAAWEGLHEYSFVEHISGSQWSSIRAEMRSALKNQPSALERVKQDHQAWKEYWSGRSKAVADEAAGLAWYHSYCLDPSAAMDLWKELTESARKAIPARMREHFSLLQWVEPLGLWEGSPAEAPSLFCLGNELALASWNVSSNQLKAIGCLEAVLRVRTEQEFPQDWAVIQINLGNAWWRVPTGDRSANLEKAIACYEAALRVRTEQEFPEDWAMTQNNLGNAWSDLPTGDRSANLEKAVACYEAALRVYTEQEFPEDWAMTQNNLGNAWQRMPTGDRSANLEKAIAYHEAALRVRTEQGFPQNWAMTQNNLGNAWQRMPTGDRSANLEKAIACYEAALRVRTEQEFPQDWAMTQNNLGKAWQRMPTGDRSANLEKAIACYEAALRVSTEQEFPRDWATTQNNLGNAWSDLPTGDRSANLEKAVACYEAALRVSTEQEFPRDWATTQNNLGNAWQRMPTGDRSANLEKAVACYEAALRVRTEQEFPEDWAMTQNNLGSAWSDLPTGDRSANLEKAIACYEAALRVRTEQEFPEDWAMTQNNLGNAWQRMPTGDRSANPEKAVACYEAALRVFTERGFPRQHREVAENLSSAQVTLADLQTSGDTYPAE